MEVEEILDTYSEQGHHIGTASRKIVHQSGLWHRSVNVFVFNSKMEVLIQQRSPTKDVCPSLWDVSVGEHIAVSESSLDAAVRGLHEELSILATPSGLTLLEDSVRFCYDSDRDGIHDHEFQTTYVYHYDGNISPNEEVEKIQYSDINSIIRGMNAEPSRFAPWFIEAVTRLKDQLLVITTEDSKT